MPRSFSRCFVWQNMRTKPQSKQIRPRSTEASSGALPSQDFFSSFSLKKSAIGEMLPSSVTGVRRALSQCGHLGDLRGIVVDSIPEKGVLQCKKMRPPSMRIEGVMVEERYGASII